MHPNPAYAWTDEDQLRAFVAEVSFAHLFASTPEGPMVAHAPVIVTETGDLRFHLARSNRLVKHLDGAVVLASVMGGDFYISPDWYQSLNQVPTWDYEAVEVEGVCRPLSGEELLDQINALSAVHEARLAPKRPWTTAKMAEGSLQSMMRGILGFEVKVTALRGTAKLSQNKGPADLEGVIAALDALGQTGAAERVRLANAEQLAGET